MTTGVFDNTQPQDQVVDTNTTPAQTVYIGDGKKYKTVEDADKAFGHLNSHVAKIEQENREMREKLAKAKTVEEVLDTIKQQSTQTSYGTDYQTGSAAQAKEIDLDAVIADKLSSWEVQQLHKQNAQTVNRALIERFGSKAQEMFEAKKQELGIDLDALAVQSPKAVLEFFPKQTPQTAEPGTINTSYVDNNQPKIGTKSYWNQMFKDKKISREQKYLREHESLEKLGWEAFNK